MTIGLKLWRSVQTHKACERSRNSDHRILTPGYWILTSALSIEFEPVIMPAEETVLYEPWVKQVKYTEQAAMANPMKLLPLFHYDPRRWQKPGNAEPFEKVGGSGMYLGFKIYTAQGYRPLDGRLPILDEFYAQCGSDIPVMNHCTPEGGYTFDRKEYIRFTHPNDTAADENQKEKYKRHLGPGTFFYTDKDAVTYFNEHFVSPDSWKPVLVKYPGLRLCLAHFGGYTKVGRKWADQIIELMNVYPNVYSDISSSFSDTKFRTYFINKLDQNPILRDRIIFGTDWFLILLGNTDYPEFHQDAKQSLDEYDLSLWTRFTLINPFRFYRLPEIIESKVENMIALNKKMSMDPLLDVKVISPKDIIQARKDAAYIKEVYEVHKTLGDS